MRSGLIAIGVVLLVLGTVFYALPITGTEAIVQGTNEVGSVSRNFLAQATIPMQLSIAAMVIGFILLLLGLAIPSSKEVVVAPEHVHTTHNEKRVVYEKRRS